MIVFSIIRRIKMFKQKEVLIGSTQYTINTLSATKALSLQPKVMKLIGRSVIEFMSAGDVAKADSTEITPDIEANVLSRIAEVFLEDMEKVDIASLSKELIESCVFKNGMSVDFDSEFTGNLVTLYRLLFEVIKFNFLDVFLNLASDKK